MCIFMQSNGSDPILSEKEINCDSARRWLPFDKSRTNLISRIIIHLFLGYVKRIFDKNAYLCTMTVARLDPIPDFGNLTAAE